MFCSLCRQPLQYIHGHGMCVNPACPLKGQNQAPCCEGEVAQEICPPEEKEPKKDEES